MSQKLTKSLLFDLYEEPVSLIISDFNKVAKEDNKIKHRLLFYIIEDIAKGTEGKFSGIFGANTLPSNEQEQMIFYKAYPLETEIKQVYDAINRHMIKTKEIDLIIKERKIKNLLGVY